MDQKDKAYYREMLVRNRLVPFREGNRLMYFITYWITTKDKEPWSIIEEDVNGSTCYVEQMISDRYIDNPKLSVRMWRKLRDHIKTNHPSVTTIKWKRYKGGEVHVYHKDIK